MGAPESIGGADKLNKLLKELRRAGQNPDRAGTRECADRIHRRAPGRSDPQASVPRGAAGVVPHPGEPRGTVRIPEPTAAERRILAELLGRKHKVGPVSFMLQQLDAALRSSSFGCSLGELLESLQGSTLVTRPMDKRRRQARHDAWRHELENMLPRAPEARIALEWGCDRLPSLHQRFKDASAATQRSVRNAFALVLTALRMLPCQPPERLAVFATSVAKDPHAFDRDHLAGQLLTSALVDLSGDGSPGGRPTAESRSAIFERFGLLVDTVWATVAAYNLAGALLPDGTADPLIEAAGGRVLNLSARQLARWCAVQPAGTTVYVVENPSVFEALVDQMESEGRHAGGALTLICTAGYLSQPARRLLDLLVASGEGVTLRYSGDFDPEGLEIASAVLSRYPHRSRPWRLDVADYERIAQDGLPAEQGRLRGLDRVSHRFPELVAAIRRHRVWVYQESLIDLLLGDVIANG